MNVLDSPVEALAFNYVSFGIFAFVNSLWPLVAVLTAAVSFWRIKAAAGIIMPVKKLVDEVPSKPHIFATRPEDLTAVEEEPSPDFSPPSPAAVPAECCNGVTKGEKFVLYYENDEIEMTAAAEVAEEAEEESSGGGSEEEWWGRWERVLRMRKGEMGWYRYQDLTVINGNVVRLWEDCGGGGGGEKCSSARAVLCGSW